jgi:hypothetical protein
MRDAFAEAFLLWRFEGPALLSPNSINWRIAADRDTPLRAAHFSISEMSGAGSRAATIGSAPPVDGRPGFRITFIAFTLDRFFIL